MQPPNYRDAENPQESCQTCAYFRANWCEMYEVAVQASKTCDKWTETRSEVSMQEPYWEQRKDYSTAARKKLASEGKALDDGSYPIVDAEDLKNAARLAASGHGNVSAAKALIRRRAKALGVDVNTLPGFGSKRAFEPDEPDADNMGGPDDGDGDKCTTCEGTGETDFGNCPDCQGSGIPKGEGLMAGMTMLSASSRLKGTTERRSFSMDGAEIRTTSDGGLRFSGYASITETPYDVGAFEETFARGAFKRCLNDSPDVCLLINHEGLPLARTSSGTLTLTEDSRGLKVDADLDPSDPDVASLAPKMRRGDLTEMSFAFRALEDEWSENDTKRLVRSATIHRGDVSVVTRGANTNTTASIRSVIEEMELRAGKTISKATRERLERIKQEAEELLAKPEEEAAEEAQTGLESELKISVMRGQLDVARARRRRYA